MVSWTVFDCGERDYRPMYFACFTASLERVIQVRFRLWLVVFVLTIACLSQEQNVVFYTLKSLSAEWSLWELPEREEMLLWEQGAVLHPTRMVPICPFWLVWEGRSIALQTSCIFFIVYSSAILLGQVKLLGMRNNSICTPYTASLALLLCIKSPMCI